MPPKKAKQQVAAQVTITLEGVPDAAETLTVDQTSPARQVRMNGRRVGCFCFAAPHSSHPPL